MRNKIFAAMAAGALLLPAFAQNYKVVVTTNDDVRTEFKTASLQDIKFGEAPEYGEANELIRAIYTSKGEGLAAYTVTVATAKADDYGYPPQVGDAELTLEFVGTASESYLDAVLPEGYYRIGAGTKAGEFDVQRSALILRLAEGLGEDGTNTYPFINGIVDVRRNGGNYVIKAEMTLFSGESVNLSYTGPIRFTPGAVEAEQFTEDQDVTFTGAQARLYSNWAYPFISDITVEFYSGEFNEGVQVEGYWFNLDLFMPKLEDPATSNPRLVDGVYTVEPRDRIENYTNIPFTFTKGHDLDFWGQIFVAGTYLNHREKNGRSRRGYITGGTITVSGNGSKVVFDLLTENGKKITSTYEGNILIENRYNPADVPPINSTLTGDVTLDFLPKTGAVSYPLGDYIKEGLNMFMIMVTDPAMQEGQYLSFELACGEDVLADGTYTINNELLPFTGIKGHCDPGANVLYSWYADLSSTDPDGVQSEIAPIMGGTVTITTVGEGKRRLVCDLHDDKGNKITGTYEGLFLDYTQDSDAPRKIRRLKASRR